MKQELTKKQLHKKADEILEVIKKNIVKKINSSKDLGDILNCIKETEYFVLGVYNETLPITKFTRTEYILDGSERPLYEKKISRP